MFGTVTKYFRDKGYGFIRGQNGKSYFIHKDAYFELPEKCKDDIGCMVTLLGMYLQRNKDVSEDDTCNIKYEIIVKEKTKL